MHYRGNNRLVLAAERRVGVGSADPGYCLSTINGSHAVSLNQPSRLRFCLPCQACSLKARGSNNRTIFVLSLGEKLPSRRGMCADLERNGLELNRACQSYRKILLPVTMEAAPCSCVHPCLYAAYQIVFKLESNWV